MHHVSKIDWTSAATPRHYSAHSQGFRRAGYVDRSVGSVHMGVGICQLDPGGRIASHLHSFEESFYVLEGSVTIEFGGKTQQLTPGDFGLISTGVPHAWRNSGTAPARWLEMQAPQPRPEDYGRD